MFVDRAEKVDQRTIAGTAGLLVEVEELKKRAYTK